MTGYTIFLVLGGVIAFVCILVTIWVCAAERWEKKMKQRSVESIIDRDRHIIK